MFRIKVDRYHFFQYFRYQYRAEKFTDTDSDADSDTNTNPHSHNYGSLYQSSNELFTST